MYNTKINFLVLFKSRKSEDTCCQQESSILISLNSGDLVGY